MTLCVVDVLPLIVTSSREKKKKKKRSCALEASLVRFPGSFSHTEMKPSRDIVIHLLTMRENHGFIHTRIDLATYTRERVYVRISRRRVRT